MNKPEALAVLHEILEACRESIMATCVSLDSPYSRVIPDGKDYRIRMKCNLDSYSRNCLKSVLEGHKLALKEEDGFVILSKPSQ